MAKQGETHGQARQRERRDSLRELLSSQGHLQHVIDLIDKVTTLENELDTNDVNRLKIGIDSKLKLINKYLPDMKFIEAELSGPDGNEIDMHWTVNVHEVSKEQ